MTSEEIRAVLKEALELVPPLWNPNEWSSAQKSEALEGYLVASANLSARLVAARHWLRAARQRIGDQWENLQGWQAAARKPSAKMTKQEIEEAKAQVAPDLYASVRESKVLSESVDDQIARLEREERALSRVYTIFSS